MSPNTHSDYNQIVGDTNQEMNEKDVGKPMIFQKKSGSKHTKGKGQKGCFGKKKNK